MNSSGRENLLGLLWKTYGMLLLLNSVVVLAIVLGVPASPAPWLAPPLLGVARALAEQQVHTESLVPLSLWALAWTAVVLCWYGWLRRRRA